MEVITGWRLSFALHTKRRERSSVQKEHLFLGKGQHQIGIQVVTCITHTNFVFLQYLIRIAACTEAGRQWNGCPCGQMVIFRSSKTTPAHLVRNLLYPSSMMLYRGTKQRVSAALWCVWEPLNVLRFEEKFRACRSASPFPQATADLRQQRLLGQACTSPGEQAMNVCFLLLFCLAVC